MKKLLLLLSIVLLTGCGKIDKDKLVNTFKNDVESSKSDIVESKMEIYSAEDTFSYDVKVFYMDDDYFKVDMVNTLSNHEQIILRNNNEVYVVTPSLNKSYKFTSEWPYNSSQAYILSTLVKDIKNDDSITFEEVDGEYVLKAKVNYPNNSELTYQKLYFDSKMNLKAVDVFDKDDILAISVKFNKINYKAKLKEEDFNIDSIVDKKVNAEVEEESDVSKVEEDETVETATLEDVIYPLYVPADTYLKEKEMINTENGERAILTFNGAKNFVLIEETTVANQEY